MATYKTTLTTNKVTVRGHQKKSYSSYRMSPVPPQSRTQVLGFRVHSYNFPDTVYNYFKDYIETGDRYGFFRALNAVFVDEPTMEFKLYDQIDCFLRSLCILNSGEVYRAFRKAVPDEESNYNMWLKISRYGDWDDCAVPMFIDLPHKHMERFFWSEEGLGDMSVFPVKEVLEIMGNRDDEFGAPAWLLEEMLKGRRGL